MADLASSRSRILAGVLGGLRVPSTPLVGREQEVEAAVERLRDPVVRMTTLSGPGGVGKTRVAVEACSAVLDDFADGVAFVPLASIRDPTLVATAIAERLGLRQAGGSTAADTLREYLEPLEFLLVLDSFEHLMDAAGWAAELVRICPGLKLLVTSREPLHLSGEHELVVPPLETPDASVILTGRGSAEFPAVDLFVQRASAANPAFELVDANASIVAQVCERLNGLPLALELAAARSKLLSPEAILTRLEHSLDLLTRGPRDMPARQRTMRGTIRWSYDLLDETEQRVFRSLCVFAGGCTLESAAAVVETASAQPVDTLDTVASLLDKSMLRRDETADGELRLGMLDTIREYGLDELRSLGEFDGGRRAHAAHYLALGEAAAGKLVGPDIRVGLELLEREQGNLRAALRSALDQADAATAVRLTAALGRFWYLRGHLSEGLTRLEEALALGATWNDPVRVRALSWACLFAYHLGRFEHSTTLGEEALELAGLLGDEHGRAFALESAALVARATGRYDESLAMYEESVTIADRLGDRHQLAASLARLAVLHMFMGNTRTGREMSEVAIEIERELGDTEGAAAATVVHAMALLTDGEDKEAQRVLDVALADIVAFGTWRYKTRGLCFAGMLAGRRGEYEPARSMLEEATAISLELGEPMYAVVCMLELANVLLGQKQDEAAARLLGSAVVARATAGSSIPPVHITTEKTVTVAAREALGEKRFNAGFEQGGQMTLEQAFATLPPPVTREPVHPTGLTARELEVLGFVAQGLSDAEVADALVVSRRTVHAHLRSIYRKLDLRSRSAATRYAIDHDLV